MNVQFKSEQTQITQVVFFVHDEFLDFLDSECDELFNGKREIRMNPSLFNAKDERSSIDLAMFWKIKEGDSRLLLSHPEEMSYVITVALLEKDLKSILEKVRVDSQVNVNQLFPLNHFSNVELIFQKSPA
tara:strand:+ start:927 stop:1316 length:390 start_codon:yes stop_codon:yes gene_type:complete